MEMREAEGKAERNYYELMIRTSIPHPSKLLDRRTEVRSKGVMLSLRERKKKKVFHLLSAFHKPNLLELPTTFCNSNFSIFPKSRQFCL